MLIDEDTSRLRQLNDISIQNETQRIELLQQCLRESEENTTKMTNILSTFETKLTSMHDLVMPVYEATNTLQIKYSNLQKTVSQLDSIIEYYDSVKNLSLVIQAGPGKDIKNYLTHLNKLKLAIEYFATNKNQTQKEQNEELWNQGILNVEKKFELLLSKCSDGLLHLIDQDIDLNDSNLVDRALPNHIKDSDLDQITDIMEWFQESDPNFLDKLYEKIIKVRSQSMIEALKNLKDKIGSLKTNSSTSGFLSVNQTINLIQSGGSQPNKRNSLSTNNMTSNNGTLTTVSTTNNVLGSPNPSDDKKNSLRTRITDIRRKTLKGNGSTLNANDTMQTNPNKSVYQVGQYEQDFETTDCIRLVESMRKAQRMFLVELKFVTLVVINSNDKIMQSKILERIFDPILRSFIIDAEKLAENVKQITNKCTSKFVIAMFKLLSEMVQMKAPFLNVFSQSSIVTKTTRHLSNSIKHFLDIFITIEKTCVLIMREAIEEIKNDPPNVAPNGNIHQITIETLTFVENLLPFDIIAGSVAHVAISENQSQMVPSEVEENLRREASKANEAKFTRIAYQLSSESICRDYRLALADYIIKILRWLDLNLNNKAESYSDQNLKWIFLLNNTYKISKLFQQESNNFNYDLQNKMQSSATKFDGYKTLNDLFMLVNKKNLKDQYQSEISKYKREYTKCWDKLLSYIRDLNASNPFSDGKLKDRDRQILKERFSSFNKEFEEIYETQIKYLIPNEQYELADMMRQDNIMLVATQYKKFYETYSNVGFSKNKEKYVKYSPEMLSARMREFFNCF